MNPKNSNSNIQRLCYSLKGKTVCKKWSDMTTLPKKVKTKNKK